MTRSATGKCFLFMAMAAIAGLVPAAPGCGRESDSQGNVLTIFHAGSLSVPLREISELFMKEHPGITVEAEAAGSRDSARKICDLGRPCDVLASADYGVVAELLMPDHAEFNIQFACNEMVIAYTAGSAMANTISAANWREALLEDSVAVGRADPHRDPCGYRTLMTFQLAEKHYQAPGLAAKLITKSEKYVRPKETDLLALLESAEIDYLFIYRSVAKQHGLLMILLPDRVNLKRPDLASLYSTVSVSVTGKDPGTMMTLKGESMVYSVTIPRNAPNRKAAEEWVALLLSPRGRAIIEKHGQPWSGPALADGFDLLPKRIKPFCARAEPTVAEARQ